MESFGRFYGSDWLGMVGNLFGAWFLTKQRKLGFLLGTIGCIGWLIFGIVAESMPSVISNLIYIGINIRGWIKWKKNPPRECSQSAEAN